MGYNKRPKQAVIFDRHTGEFMPVELAKTRKAIYTYMGGFVVISIEGIRMIQRERITGRLREVVDALCVRLYGNVVTDASISSLANEMGIDRSNLSKLIGRLEQARIIMRGTRRGTMYFNPHIAFRGSALLQRAAVREWDAAHRPTPVPSQAA